MAINTFSTYALLSVKYEKEGQSYLDSFIPFIVEAALECKDKIIETNILKKELNNIFGLSIPEHAISLILKRGMKIGYFSINNNMYSINEEKCKHINIRKDSENYIRQCNSLITKYIEYVEKQSERKITEEIAIQEFFKYLNKFSALISCDAKKEFSKQAKQSRNELHYLLHSFLKKIYENDDNLYTIFNRIIQGYALSSVLYRKGVEDFHIRYRGIDIYLDTPFLLRAFGFYGKNIQNFFIEIIDIIKESGARLTCFEHTERETKNVLKYCFDQYKNPRNGRSISDPIVNYWHTNNISINEVLQQLSSFNTSLHNYNIEIKPTLIRNIKRFNKHRADLQKVIDSLVKYKRYSAIINDIDSLLSTYALRDGKIPFNIVEAKAIFLTTNSSLAQASFTYFSEYLDYKDPILPICFHCEDFATLLWLRKPLLRPEFPNLRVLADSYMAMKPSEELWNDYCKKLNKQLNDDKITTDDYNILLFSNEARFILIERTYNQADNIDDITLHDILKTAKQQLINDYDEKITVMAPYVEYFNAQKTKRIRLYTKGSLILLNILLFSTICSLQYLLETKLAAHWKVIISFAITFLIDFLGKKTKLKNSIKILMEKYFTKIVSKHYKNLLFKHIPEKEQE